MSHKNWKDKNNSFQTMDVRGVSGNFFPGLKAKEGLNIIQTFEPVRVRLIWKKCAIIPGTMQEIGRASCRERV